MKRYPVFILILSLSALAQAQTSLTLHQCYAQAESNYPLVKQRELLQKARLYSVQNAAAGILPQINIGGQATYQSEVTRIPLEMPGVEPMSKDQYRLSAEVSQTLYHGGIVEQRKALEDVSGGVEEQRLEVELYQIKSRINELFFGILLLQEQIAQTRLAMQDIRTALKKVDAAIANGTAIRSAADVLQAEILRLEQRLLEMQSTADSYRTILGLFIHQVIGRGTVLERPAFADSALSIERPELRLFKLQKQVLDVNERVLAAAKRPRVDVFAQGGYGRPGLNMLENEFGFYYLGGIRFTWQLSGYYTFGREKEIVALRRKSVEAQKETFLFNTSLSLDQHETEIARLRALMGVDDEIIALRTRVRQTAAAQLEEGVITPADYIREVNAEDQAKQNRALHATQLLLAQAKHRFTSGH